MSNVLSKNEKLKVQSIILSAGFSTRMGEDKALLNYQNYPLIIHLIRKIEQFSNIIYIVLGNNFDIVKKNIENYNFPVELKFIKNQHPESGMFSSVKLAFEAIEDSSPILFQLIDHPFVSQQIYKQLLNSYNENFLIFKPSYTKNNIKKAGHPVLFSTEFIKIIAKESIDSNLRKVINRYKNRIYFVEVDDDTILQNLNTKYDFR